MRASISARAPTEVAGHEADILAGSQVREQPALLDDVAHAAAHREHVRGGQVLAVNNYGPGIRSDQARDDPDQRRFAAAARAQQRQGHPSLNHQPEGSQCYRVGE